MNIDPKTMSPCVRKCCLDSNDVCLGCFRHLDEIVGWSKLADNDKKNILKKCEQRMQSSKQRGVTNT